LAGIASVLVLIAIALGFRLGGESDASAGAMVIRDDSTGGDCGQVGTWSAASKTCTLTADVEGKFIIESDGVTLDGNGHSVTGTGPENPDDYVWGSDGGGIGVHIKGTDGVTVRNAVFSRFDDSIKIDHSNATTVTGITSSLSGMAGVSFDHGTKCTISANSFSIPAKQSTGICMGYESTGNTITSNTVKGYELGIYLHTLSTGNVLSNNNLVDNKWNVTFFEQDGENTVSGNKISGGEIGIYLHDRSDNIIIRSNTISGADKGIFLEEVSGAVVHSNSLLGNTVQAEATGGESNSFGLPSPTGGNFWSDYASPENGCSDIDANGFCDAALITSGIEDPAPWLRDKGWE
jgi:parallel beta-helix repeat protein